jgi:hypothetical protein
VYVDGHHGVGTSNHQSVGQFAEAFGNSLLLKQYCEDYYWVNCQNMGRQHLHTFPNISGFNKRASSGAKAAEDLINKINQGIIIFNKQTDTLDIVAHSMGYAYAVGMINELKKHNIHFGRFYIIAPENACSGGCDWTMFKEVWQYGSNLGEPDEDRPCDQDGVAPQCGAPGLEFLPNAKTNGGRVFIPKKWKPKGFLDCHTVANYTWIFSNIKVGELGYIKPR